MDVATTLRTWTVMETTLGLCAFALACGGVADCLGGDLIGA
jgi:hypothetical protein